MANWTLKWRWWQNLQMTAINAASEWKETCMIPMSYSWVIPPVMTQVPHPVQELLSTVNVRCSNEPIPFTSMMIQYEDKVYIILMIHTCMHARMHMHTHNMHTRTHTQHTCSITHLLLVHFQVVPGKYFGSESSVGGVGLPTTTAQSLFCVGGCGVCIHLFTHYSFMY